MRPVVLQQGCALAARPQLRRPVRRAHAVSASALDVLLGPAVDVLPPRRAEMKRALLAAVAPTQRGARASPAQAAAVRCLALRACARWCVWRLAEAVCRAQIDAAAAALEARSPSASPVQSLAGLWQLAYTTEADVHAFCRYVLRVVLPYFRIRANLSFAQPARRRELGVADHQPGPLSRHQPHRVAPGTAAGCGRARTRERRGA